LDLELELVSKKTVPAVKSIVRSSTSADLATAHKMIQKEMNLYENVIASATQVSSLANSDLKKLRKAVADIDRFKLDNSALKAIESSRIALEYAIKQTRFWGSEACWPSLLIIRLYYLLSSQTELKKQPLCLVCYKG